MTSPNCRGPSVAFNELVQLIRKRSTDFVVVPGKEYPTRNTPPVFTIRVVVEEALYQVWTLFYPARRRVPGAKVLVVIAAGGDAKMEPRLAEAIVREHKLTARIERDGY